jgi:uncharacterized membrane protein
MRKSEIIFLGLVLLSFLMGFYFYPQMPERVASHWNASGQVDGYMPRFWGVFFMPVVLIVMALLFILIPRIDPLKHNIEQFRRHYDAFIFVLMVYMMALHLQTLLWNIGFHISPNATMPVGVGLLFFYAGIMIENAKMNWFIGIRTPWTLSSEVVWDKTHKVGGKMFKIAGLIGLSGVFFQSYAVYFILIPALFVAVYTIVYSYIAYKQL